MICKHLQSMILRACEFSKRDDLAQNCVFKIKSEILEIRASNGTTGICLTSVFCAGMADIECAVNIYALNAALSTLESESDIKIYIKNSKLIIKDRFNGKIKMNTMDVDTVFYIPKPQHWKQAPKNFFEKINAIKSIYIKNIKGLEKDHEDLIIIKGHDICKLSRSVYVFDVIDTDLDISIDMKFLNRIPNVINAYCVENNRLYLKNIDEWCMLPIDNRKTPKYKILFDEVQKLNTSVIRINSDLLLNFCEKLLSLKLAEELSTLNSTHFVKLDFSENELKGITDVGEIRLPIKYNGPTFLCGVVSDFIKSISSKIFNQSKEIELHVGVDANLILAVCGTIKVIGARCRV